MKYVEKIQVLLVDEVNPENTTIKTYDGKECCAVFWGPAGRGFYVDAIMNDSSFTLQEQDRRLSMLHEIENAATEEELVFVKTTECTPR